MGVIRNGADEVRIYGTHYKVNAEVKVLDSFSAHGDQQEMLDYLDNLNRHKLKKNILGSWRCSSTRISFETALKDNKFQQGGNSSSRAEL